MKILVRGPVDERSGYGCDVVGLLIALQEAGQDVDVWPQSVYPPLPSSVAHLFTRPIKPPYDVVLWYTDPAQLNPAEMPGWGRVHLGWTMWERTPFTTKNLGKWYDPESFRASRGHVWSQPSEWRTWEKERLDEVYPKDWLDGLIVTCPENVPAFQAADASLRIAAIPAGLRTRDWPARTSWRDSGPVSVGAHGVMAARRKNPAGLIEAWRLHLKDRTVETRLVIKTSGSRWPVTGYALDVPDVEVVVGDWSKEQMLGWYHGLDLLVSASRGEGMNKPALEAMATGIPVVATAAAGHATWMSEDWGYPVRHHEVESDLEPGTTDWPVDVEHLAQRLTEATADHDARRRRGQRAAGVVRAHLDWSHSAAKFLRLAAQLMQ